MADVFVSYKSEDRTTTARVADLLRLNELSVWWDDKLQGERADDVIRCEIASAKAVVVLMSRRAVRSDWVRGEIARANDKIVPVRIDDIPYADLPTPLLPRDIIDLSRWNGQADHAEFPKLLARCNELKSRQKSAVINSVPKAHSTTAPEAREKNAQTGPVINIGTITGGTIVGGIGSTHYSSSTGRVDDPRLRDDEP